ncbi:23S rRNA (uracil(1939)-C(5))-methyltransferase RlmD [bacterium]|nr:23S rRNA (uracil(1939)-C(5))-methyltransferase RlmD [bacterium]
MTSEITAEIENLAVGGAFIGKVTSQPEQGMKVFIPYVAPGEKVHARITKRCESYLEAQVIEIDQPSPQRISPVCPYYQQCGGCELQHGSYQAQLVWKYEMIKSALKARGAENLSSLLAPIVASPPYGYRRRVTLHLSKEGQLGFYQPNSRTVVTVQSCAVATLDINRLLPKLQNILSSYAGAIIRVALEQGIEGVHVIFYLAKRIAREEVEKLLSHVKADVTGATVLEGETVVAQTGSSVVRLEIPTAGDKIVELPPGAFSQVNWEINSALVSAVLQRIQADSTNQIIDLYSGAGNFSLPLALQGHAVIAVEVEKRLVDLGIDNVIRFKLGKQLKFIQSTVEKFVKDELKFHFGATVIADPPRSGLGKVAMNMSAAGKILLISCHLPSFIRDVVFMSQHGWKVKEIIPFDMFAQTAYVEILTVLERERR